MEANCNHKIFHDEKSLFERYNLETYIGSFVYPYSGEAESSFISKEDLPIRSAHPRSFSASSGAREVTLGAFFDGYGGLDPE